MGRPSKLTIRVQEKICLAIRAGSSPEGAAGFAGIDRATFYRWLEAGRRGRSKRYLEFMLAVEKAKADVETRVSAKLLKGIDDGRLELAVPFLERRFPDRWGKRDRVSIDADVNITPVGGGVLLPPLDGTETKKTRKRAPVPNPEDLS